ncbi:hypothetical protein [Mixta mediterraneensis]|uniref:hypothetical protein n=1 Tax=Mixta mediterraneensis TaxID=2758443 RepID=UPI003B0040D5
MSGEFGMTMADRHSDRPANRGGADAVCVGLKDNTNARHFAGLKLMDKNWRKPHVISISIICIAVNCRWRLTLLRIRAVWCAGAVDVFAQKIEPKVPAEPAVSIIPGGGALNRTRARRR